MFVIFFFKQKTAYEMRISDCSSDVCSSDLERQAAALGLRLYKVAMPWPLEPEGIRDFATGLEQIIVVEEKRGLVEDQLSKHLYGLANATVIVGKCDEKGQWLFPSNGERSEARRVGKECVGRWRYRWGPLP